MSSVNENTCTEQGRSIPNGWMETTLGDVCKIKYGKDHKKLEDGNIPCYGSGGIMRYVDSILYDKPSVLIPRKGTLSNLFFIDEPFWTVDTLFYTQIDESIIKSNYLYYKLKTYNLADLNVGSAVPSLTTAVLNQFPFSIPKNIEEQKAIAKILSAFDDKIENLQAQNNTLEETAQTIFKEWFGKFQNQNEIPQDMTLGTLDDFIGELESGKRPKGGVGQFVDGIPSVGAENVKNIGVYDYSKTKYVPEEFFNKMTSGIVKDYDILIYKDGGTPGTFIPHFTIVGEGFPFSRFCINEHVFRIQPKNEYQRFYLYSWLDSYYCRKLLQNIGGKAAIPGINSTDLREIEMLIPSYESLKQFHKVVQPMYKKLLINSRNINTLQKIRDTLLPKLMSGQLRVNEFKE